MKTEEEFRKFYDEHLKQDLRGEEVKRKKHVVAIAISFFATTFLVSAEYIVTEGVAFGCTLPVMFLVQFFLIFGVLFFLIKGSYHSSFKKDVLPKILHFIDPSLRHEYNKAIPYEYFAKSNIFLDRPDVYEGEDLIWGTFGKTRILFSEVVAKKMDRDGTEDPRDNRHYRQIFKGVFFAADFNKYFKGQTLVLPDAAENMFGQLIGSFLQSKNPDRPQLVKLEDPDFERHFVVYSNDQVEARYILSSSLMERITSFRERSGSNIYLSFVDDHVMIAIPTNRNLFEASLDKSIQDYNLLKQFFNDLQFLIGIVDDLNLNTRIWSKK